MSQPQSTDPSVPIIEASMNEVRKIIGIVTHADHRKAYNIVLQWSGEWDVKSIEKRFAQEKVSYKDPNLESGSPFHDEIDFIHWLMLATLIKHPSQADLNLVLKDQDQNQPRDTFEERQTTIKNIMDSELRKAFLRSHVFTAARACAGVAGFPEPRTQGNTSIPAKRTKRELE